MKNSLFLIILFIITNSCMIPTLNFSKEKRDASNFILKKNPYSNLDSLEIISIDSAFTPYISASFLTTNIMETSLQIEKIIGSSWNALSKKHSIILLDSAIFLYLEKSRLYDSLQTSFSLAAENPQRSNIYENRKYIKIKYIINDTKYNDILYYERNGDSISHNQSDICNALSESLNALNQLYKSYNEAKQDKQDMISGKYISNSWK